MVVLDLALVDGSREQFTGPLVGRPPGYDGGRVATGAALAVLVAVVSVGALGGYLVGSRSPVAGSAVGALIGLALMPMVGTLVRAVAAKLRSGSPKT